MGRVLMSEVNIELTEDELREIEALDERPIVFDEDSPEMTSEMLEQFHGFHTIPINVSPSSMKKAKSFGKNYVGILSKLLDMAINDPEMVRRCV